MDRLLLSDRTVDLETGEVSTGDGLRPMELRVLRYLTGRGGAAVSLEELLQSVWRYAPGIRTRTVHSTLYRIRQVIEAHPGSPVHLVTVPGGVRLVAAIRSTPTPNNLSPRPDRFVGREAELAWLRESDARLISVVGPSGVGKTRLVTEWANDQLARFPGGVWLVDAVGAQSPGMLTERIGAVLHCAPDELRDVLRSRGDVLLVIDDVAEDLAEAIQALVDGCRIVVTSHSPLDLAGEQRIRLGPLGPPSEGLEGPGVELLVARILEDAPAFDADSHAVPLAELTRALEGFPLALELAASYAALLGPADALAALRSSGRFANRRQDRPPHHRSTEAMIEHTVSLLPASARRALLQLSVIERTFSLDLATRLLAGEGGVELLGTLVARGLVRTTANGRYRLYDLVRSFARTQAVDPGYAARWIACYADLAAEVREDGLVVDLPVLGPEELEAWESVTYRVLSEGRSALPEPEAAIVVFTWIAAHRSLRGEIAHAVAARLGDATLPPVCRTRYRSGVARFGFRDLDPESFRLAEQVADEAAVLGLVQVEAEIRLALARIQGAVGRLPEAIEAEKRGRALLAFVPPNTRSAARLGIALAQADSTIHWGMPVAVVGAERAVALADQLGESQVRWAGMLNVAAALHEAGLLDRARQVVLGLLTEHVDDIRRARALALWSRMLATRGRGREASALGDEAMSLLETQVQRTLVASVCLWRVEVRIDVGDDAGAELDLAYMRARCGSPLPPWVALKVDYVQARIDACRGGPNALRGLGDVVQRVQALGVSWWTPLEVLAEVQAASGDLASALATLDTLPGSVSPRGSGVRVRVEVLRGLGRHADAVRLLSTVSPDRDGFGWTRQALAAARWEAGEVPPDPGPPDDDEPWSRVWLARIARVRGDSAAAALLLDGATHTTRPPLLGRAIDELRSRPTV